MKAAGIVPGALIAIVPVTVPLVLDWLNINYSGAWWLAIAIAVLNAVMSIVQNYSDVDVLANSEDDVIDRLNVVLSEERWRKTWLG